MSDDLRAALSAAVEESEQKDESQIQQPEPVVEAPSAEPEGEPVQASDEESGTAEPVEAQPADATQQKAQTPADRTPAREHRVDRAPASWKKEAKGEWAALPLHVRQEVYRREQEINRVLQEAAPARQMAEQFQQTVSPYMQRIQAAGVNPIQAVGSLLQTEYTLATGTQREKAALMAKFISEYGIDIADLDEALAQSLKGQPQNPQQDDLETRLLSRIQQQFAPVLTFAQQQQQAQMAQQQRVEQEAVQTIEQMSLDPKYPYFEDVRQEMADLIEVAAKRGVYLTPEQAYHRAVQLNPDVYGEVQKQGMMSQANQQHQQAQRAKIASSSVTGAPAAGGDSRFQGDGSLRGAIEAAFGGQRI